MRAKLKKYLVCLAVEPGHFSEFVADPQAAAEKAGLSQEDQAILLSGDQNRIYAAVAAGREQGAVQQSRPSRQTELD